MAAHQPSNLRGWETLSLQH